MDSERFIIETNAILAEVILKTAQVQERLKLINQTCGQAAGTIKTLQKQLAEAKKPEAEIPVT
jgi:hypothetical protein